LADVTVRRILGCDLGFRARRCHKRCHRLPGRGRIQGHGVESAKAPTCVNVTGGLIGSSVHRYGSKGWGFESLRARIIAGQADSGGPSGLLFCIPAEDQKVRAAQARIVMTCGFAGGSLLGAPQMQLRAACILPGPGGSGVVPATASSNGIMRHAGDGIAQH
jgi:hypothetical protein